MDTKLCSICFNETEQDPCPICNDDTHNGEVIIVVEQPSYIPLLESQGFRVRYHVLHGVISPRDGIGPDQLKIRELIRRVERGDVNELICWLLDGQEGDATEMTIQQDLNRAGLSDIKFRRVTRGSEI